MHDDHYQADIIRAPEITLGYQWSTPVDIWSIGCLVSFTAALILLFLITLSQVFELVTDFHLFGQLGPYSADVHLQNIVEYLGSFPPQFLEACSRRAEYFNENGQS